MDTLQEFKSWLEARDTEIAEHMASRWYAANPLEKHRQEMVRERLSTALNLIDEFKQAS